MLEIRRKFNKYTIGFFAGVSEVALFAHQSYFLFNRTRPKQLYKIKIKETLLKIAPTYQNAFDFIQTLEKSISTITDQILKIELNFLKKVTLESKITSSLLEEIANIYLDEGFTAFKKKLEQFLKEIISLKVILEGKNQTSGAIMQKAINLYEQLGKFIIRDIKNFYVLTSLCQEIKKRSVAVAAIQPVYEKLFFVKEAWKSESISLAQICREISESFSFIVSKFLDCEESVAYLLTCRKSKSITSQPDAFYKIKSAMADRTTAVILQVINDTDIKIIETFRFETGDSLLHWAIKFAHTDIINLLLIKKCNPNLLNDDDDTALHIAAKRGRDKIIELLIKAGGVIQANHLQQTPLHLAAQGAHLQSLKVLLMNGANVPDFFGRTPLYYVVQRGSKEAVQVLLAYGADPMMHDLLGWSSLHKAVAAEEADLIDLLMPDNQIIKMLGSKSHWDYQTPMHLAVRFEKPNILAQLHRKETAAIASAIKETEREKYSEYFLSINLKDSSGNTPLHLAKRAEATECEKILESLGADRTIKNSDEYTPKEYGEMFKPWEDVNRFADNQIKESKKLLKCCKTLYSIYGSKEILKLFRQAGIKFLEGDDGRFFTVELLKQELSEFLSMEGKESLLINKVLDYFTTAFTSENLDIEKIAKDSLQNLDFRLLILGHSFNHEFPIAIKREKKQIILTIFDRSGVFLFARTQLNKVTAIAKFRFAVEQSKQMLIFKNVLYLIKRMSIADMKAVNEIFCTKLPEFIPLEIEWDSWQKQYDTATCFWENYKPFRKNIFIEIFGDDVGLWLYKQFEIYVLVKPLADFKSYEAQIEPNIFKQIIKICENICANKTSKLEKIGEATPTPIISQPEWYSSQENNPDKNEEENNSASMKLLG